MKVGLMLSVILWGFVAFYFSGCGVARVDLWGAKVEFAQGWDVHAGLNNIAEVDNRRGVNSAEFNYKKLNSK